MAGAVGESERVSVVIPTYNRAALVGRAVRSALAETSPGDEVIVVDDGSTDDTEEALAPYRDRIRYFRARHGKAGAARNHGVREARNGLVAFLDSDDEWMPDKLVLQRAALAARPDAVFCFSDFAVRDASGAEHRRYLSRWNPGLPPWSWAEVLGPGVPFSSLAPLPPGRDDFPVYTGDLYPAQLDRLFVLTTTLLVRRSTAGSALHFPEDLPYSEDWECLARLARAGPVVYLDCETAWQYDHGGPRMTDIALEDRDATQLRVLERVWGRDGEFLARHRKWYESVVRRLHLRRARSMIVRGRTAEARAELRLVGGAPLGYRLLAALPGAVARTLFALRRGFRRTP